MPRTFNDSLEDDIENVFLNVDEFAVTVSIRREAFVTTGVKAIVATKSDEANARTTDRISLKVQKRDYRIRAAAYIANGVQSLPTEGDEIIETLKSGVVVTSQVLRTSDRPCYELDSSGLLLLVHTKRI